MGTFDYVTFPLSHNFYDDYKNREATKVQDMSIAGTMVMGYILEVFNDEAATNKEVTISRMNTERRKSLTTIICQ